MAIDNDISDFLFWTWTTINLSLGRLLSFGSCVVANDDDDVQ